MSDKKYMLIVDNEMPIDPSLMFTNTPADVEVRVARTADQAMEILQDWADHGITCDLITVDGRLDYGLRGGTFLASIVEWGRANDRVPRKAFLHSATPDMHVEAKRSLQADGVDVEITSNDDIHDIMRHLRRKPRSLDFQLHRLRSYTNEHWGTDFVFDSLQAAILAGAIKKEEVYKLETLVRDEKLSAATAIDYVDLGKVEKILLPSIKANSIPNRYLQLEPDDPNWDMFEEPFRVDFKQASGGSVAGHLAFSAEDLHDLKAKGKTPILVVQNDDAEILPLLDDVGGVIAWGEYMGHISLVCSNHGIPFAVNPWDNDGHRLETVDGISSLNIAQFFEDKETRKTLRTGDPVTLGQEENQNSTSQASLYDGHFPVVFPSIDDRETLQDWAEASLVEFPHPKVKANADNPAQVQTAIEQGAAGIGLLRTEHLLRDATQQHAFRDYLLGDASTQQSALNTLREHQQQDFTAIFTVAAGAPQDFPVNVRLLDAPPQEFLHTEDNPEKIEDLKTRNVRGARFAQEYPDFYPMQAEAIFTAAATAGYRGTVEIMIPLVRSGAELAALKATIDAVAERHGQLGKYKFGAMIETKDALEDMQNIAAHADFLSFGTNDLTAELTGVPRGDRVAMQQWLSDNFQYSDPTYYLTDTIQYAIRRATEEAREQKPDIPISICGDQARNSTGIRTASVLKFDSVSLPANSSDLFFGLLQLAQIGRQLIKTEKTLKRGRSLVDHEIPAGGWSARETEDVVEKDDPFLRL